MKGSSADQVDTWVTQNQRLGHSIVGEATMGSSSKAAKDGPWHWAPATLVEDQGGALGLGPAQLQLLQLFGA